MTAVAVAPDSPPDLSGSKSSKSSSFHSSPHGSATDGILADISNFEDIGLDEDVDVTYLPQSKSNSQLPFRASLRSPQSSTLRSNEYKGQKANSRMAPVRDLTPTKTTTNNNNNNNNNDAPNSSGQSNGSLGLPRLERPSRRRLSRPSVPSLQPRSSSAHRSQSQSPTNTPILSPERSRSVSRSRSNPPPRPTNSERSPSKQRKTIEELEQEYHDSDEDLPEDATLWNVPISPRPPDGRSGEMSPSRSPGPRPLPLSHSVSASPVPSPPSSPPDTPKSAPKSRKPRANSNVAPRKKSSRPELSRASSFNVVLSDLSEEAKILTETLEFHADASAREHEERVQNGTSKSARTSAEQGKRESGGMIELPPLQRPNIMIDPLPISKEKERVLSRTRPSWLPPKDKEEEKRHLREYKKMMAQSKEADKKKAAEAASVQCKKDDTRKMLQRIWDEYVFPNWDRVVDEPRTRELWWRGITPRSRGAVWKRALGNELALTEKSFTKALERAKQAQANFAQESGSDNQSSRLKECFEAIRRDASLAFPELNLFLEGGPLRAALIDVLDAYCMYRSDVGYIHGLHTIAALVLLQVDSPASGFQVFANALNRSLPLAFLTSDPGAMSRAFSVTSSMLRLKFPRLSTHLCENLCLSDQEMFEPMFRALFTNGLEIERLSRVWDCWVFEGDRILVRTAVAILGSLESQLLSLSPGDEGHKTAVDSLGWGAKGIQKPSRQASGDATPPATSGAPNEAESPSRYWIVDSLGDQDAFMNVVRQMSR